MTTLKEALDQLAEGHELDNEQKKLIIDKWQKELGIQHYEDAISREDAIKTAIEAVDDWDGGCNLSRADIIEKAIESLPSVQPQYKTSEWCHDCSEYNHDKHCCPRFNKVIRNTIEEMKQPKTGHWIPVSERLPDEFAVVLCNTDSEEIFIATYLGKMNDGTDCFDDHDGMMWEGDVSAWMPLPEPFEPQESEEK